MKVGDASFSKISTISAWEKPRSNPRDFRSLLLSSLPLTKEGCTLSRSFRCGKGKGMAQVPCYSRKVVMRRWLHDKTIARTLFLGTLFGFIAARRLLTLAHINRWPATNVSSCVCRPLDRSAHAHDRLMLLGDVTLHVACFIGHCELNWYLNEQM